MATVYKISDDFYENSFTLLALHSSLEDFALAYAINKALKSQFIRLKNDLDISEHMTFPIFEWKDKVNDRYCTLIGNKGYNTAENNAENIGLFALEPSYVKHYLIPEHREVDYFIKIEQDHEDLDTNMLKSILDIPRVLTAYPLVIDNLKSKNNLIF